MASISNYLNDGANWQAQAVLSYVRAFIFQVEDLVNYQHKDLKLFISTRAGRFENCREQGYVFSIQVGYRQERHYAVYEHRNCDNICILISEGLNLNTPSVDFMWKDRGENPSKYDFNTEFSYGQVVECGKWIIEDMYKWTTDIITKIQKQKELEKASEE